MRPQVRFKHRHQDLNIHTSMYIFICTAVEHWNDLKKQDDHGVIYYTKKKSFYHRSVSK